MRENCAFVSLSNTAIGNEGLEEEALRNLGHLGQSLDQNIYWNKECASAGLLCGSSTGDINSVIRCLVGAHLEQEPATQVRPRVLAFHLGHHMLPEAHPEMLDTKRTTVLVSPRMMQSSGIQGSTQPLRLREQDVSLHHVLAFFTPPPYMHAATASKILTTIQYVVSQLPPEDPFDLQAFIQLIEQEKWDDEGSTFVALRQTLLTGLLSGHQDDVPLHRLNHVLLDLTDPILCDTQVENVMMDIALHAFLNTSTDQKERTLIILSSAHEYLRDSSPLLRTLESLILQRERSISVLITTTNLPSLALPPSIFTILDYIGLTGPLRSSVWLATLKANWDPIKLADAPLSFFARDTLAIISPDSQAIGTEKYGRGWEVWGNMLRALDIKEMAQYASQRILPADSQVVGDEVSIPEATHTAASELQDSSTSLRSHKAAEGIHRAGYFGGVLMSEGPTINGQWLSHAGVVTRSENATQREHAPTVGLSPLQTNPVISKANGPHSDDSSDDDGLRNGQALMPAPEEVVILNRKYTGTYVPAFFHIASDLPPQAFTRASIQATLYPTEYQLLASTMLNFTGGYSNTNVTKSAITSIINPILNAWKAPGSSLTFKTPTQMINSAWSASIIRFSVEGGGSLIFLVNPQSVVEALRAHDSLSSSGNGARAVTQNARTISPFLPLVQAVAKHTGNRAGVKVPAKKVRTELGNSMVIKAIGFPKGKQYLDEGVRLGLIAAEGFGKKKMVSLRADLDHLQTLLVRPGANT